MNAFDDALMQEINLLLKFPDTALEGIKIHRDADPGLIEAARRLHDKGLITLPDGGYLTDLGREAEETAKLLRGLLTPL